MSYLFIVNPVAGKGRGREIIPLIEEVMEANNCTYEIKVTEKAGDAKIFAEEGKSKNFSTIVSVGGDGTLHEVVNGMAEGGQALGVIPAGTGNDFARSIHIPFDLREAIEVLVKRKTKDLDLGRLNGKYFINFCSVGLDALIAEEANKIKKYFSSTYSYIIGIIKALIKFKSIHVKLEIDGTKYEGRVMLVAVCNGSYYGGGMKICPEASTHDGEFDVCIVENISKLKLLFFFPTIFKGNHIRRKEVKIYKGKNIKVFTNKDINVNADGEIVNNRPIHFEILEKKAKVIIP